MQSNSMWRIRFAAVGLLGAGALLAGCDRPDGRLPPVARKSYQYSPEMASDWAAGAESAGSASAAGAAAGPAGKGVIKGKVLYAGARPQARTEQVNCHGPVTHRDESLVVNDKGEVQNVVVYLKNAPTGAPPSKPAPLVDQKDCAYVPHVVALQTGQGLKFTSSDLDSHNVHAQDNENGAFNRVMGKGESVTYAIKAPAIFRVKCDVHPWMSMYVASFEHPYYAVTGPDGAFEIKNLPPGSYTIATWQEKLATKESEVTVTEDKPAEVTVTYGK